MPEPSTIEGVLKSLVEAIEAREAAEPDLPDWEASDRIRRAEKALLRSYRESPSSRSYYAINVSADATDLDFFAIEVA
jgi:hypothetical protein